MRGEAILVLFIFVTGLTITLAALYLRHRKVQMLHEERMAALEKGAAIPLGGPLDGTSRHGYLLRGLIWSFSGAATMIFLAGIAFYTDRPPSAEVLAYRARSVSQNLEIPLEQARQIVAKDARPDGPPPTIALLGLIPLSVGLAYLIYNRSAEARKNSMGG